MNTCGSLVFLAEFFDETAIYKILKFLIRAEAKHFFTATDGVALFQIFKNSLKKIIETEYFLFRKDVAKFISDVVWKSPGKPGSFSGRCHNRGMIALRYSKSDFKLRNASGIGCFHAGNPWESNILK